MIDKTTPAFPVPNLEHDEFFNGMTLRDYFAAKAMQGMIPTGLVGYEMDTCSMATWAYSMSDAMLKAREV